MTAQAKNQGSDCVFRRLRKQERQSVLIDAVLTFTTTMRNNDRPDAEQDGDISDDPRLSAIDRDLASVSKRNDNLLLVILLVLVPLAFVYERSGFKGVWLDAAFLGLLFGAIGYTIFRVARQKQRVAARYGLVCRECGEKPRAHMVLSAAMTQHCARCGAKLIS